VQLELEKPVLSAVLTPKEFDEENAEHQKFFFDHMLIKGREAADAAASLLESQVASRKSQVA
ncbi:MAG: 6,7-dimethyl-8-ribityllumazine synthase, partial [Gammaproteobacteria bacterium]|nr:6,7-dimethyl-8-ribityllumazine synthase [Gammaproteobacteria bacterium]